MGTTADKLNKVLQTKEAIRTAINNKGGTLTTSDKFSDYATAIDNIQSGGGDNPLQYVIDNRAGDGKPSCYYLFYEYRGSSLDNVLNKIDISSCTNMSGMFNSCYNITTIPKFNTSNITNMSSMFKYCNKLTTVPQLDTSKVTNMEDMFSECGSLTTIPQLDTSSCTNMFDMFANCKSLTTIPQLDTNKVTNMSGMFIRCSKLTTVPQLDTSSCKSFSSIFTDCHKLTTIDLTHMNITSTSNTYNFAYNCYSLTKLIIRNMTTIPPLDPTAFTDCYHFYGTTNGTYNPEGLKDGIIYVPDDKVEELKTAKNWSVFADNIFPLSLFGKPYVFDINSKSNSYIANRSSLFSMLLLDFINTPEVIITSSNEQVATISDIVITTKKITFKANYLSVGVATITIQITGDTSATKIIDVNVIEGMQCRVEQISEATYGFTLNSNDYYESTNKYKGSSYSLCKLIFNITEKFKVLKLECINSGESNFDFGILSNIDTTLSINNSEDSSTNTYKSFKGQSSTTPVVITYPEATVGEHFIYIKYRKDSGGDNGNDSLQFKVIS